MGTSCRLPSSPVPSGRGRRGGNSHLPMVDMNSPTESQWDVMQSRVGTLFWNRVCVCLGGGGTTTVNY